jgi:hypothetical protein
MSWGTCYSGSNNIYRDFPPIMNDGRNYANWQPGAVVNERIRTEANIKTNWQYRQYLCNNADAFIKFNQQSACDNCCANTGQYGSSTGQNATTNNNTPYLFKSCLDDTQQIGYENSDLKNLYLSDISLQSRMVTPVFTQSEILMKGIPRAN